MAKYPHFYAKFVFSDTLFWLIYLYQIVYYYCLSYNKKKFRMSVYLTIKSATLNKRPPAPIFLFIQSASAILKTMETPSSKTTFWESSLICSIRQRCLIFKVCCDPYYESNKQLVSQWSLETMAQGKVIAAGQLSFQYLQSQSEKEILRHIELISQNEKGYKKQGDLQLVIFYEPHKNYLGEMEFYDIGSTTTVNSLGYHTQAKPDLLDIKYQRNLRNVPMSQSRNIMPLYKGPCKTKNIFSCCDRPVNQQQFQLIEPHYIQM